MACADGSFSRQGIPRPRCVTLRSPFSFVLCLARHVAVRHGQTKKGAVSNHFLSMLRCQRGLNSSLWSSGDFSRLRAARDGSRSWKENSKKQLPFFEMQLWIQRERSRDRDIGSPRDTKRGRRRHTLITDRTRKAFGSFFYAPK